MDTDPPLTVDFVFYRVGLGKTESLKHIKPIKSHKMAARCDPNDPTIHGSDHFPIVTEFEIYPIQ